MRIQIVLHHTNQDRIRKMDIDQILHTFGI